MFIPTSQALSACFSQPRVHGSPLAEGKDVFDQVPRPSKTALGHAWASSPERLLIRHVSFH